MINLLSFTAEVLFKFSRPASSKFSGSTESLKISINLEKNVPDKMSKSEAKDRNKSSKKLDPPKKSSQVS